MATVRINAHPHADYTNVMICSGYIPWLKDWVKDNNCLWGLGGGPPGFSVHDTEATGRQTLLRDFFSRLEDDEDYHEVKARRERADEWQVIMSADDLTPLFMAPDPTIQQTDRPDSQPQTA